MPGEIAGRMQEVERVLTQAGINTFSREQLHTISQDYKTALLEGLDGRGVLPMFQSYLHPVDLSKLPERKKALIVEIGGTNLYGAIVESVAGDVAITGAHKAPLKTRKFESREQFYGAVIEGLSPLLDGDTKPDALSVVYSFPGKTQPREVGVDLISSEKLTKEFEIPGISEEPVGEALKRVASGKYPFFNHLPSVVLNDTVAVVMATGSVVGGVVGTGFNLAVDAPAGIVNTESGAFNVFPPSRAFDELDSTTNHPGAQTSEKRISGLYLPWYFTYGLKELGREGIPIRQETIEDGAVLSAILSQQPESEEDEIRTEIARSVVGQSAQIVGLMIGTLIDTFHHDRSGVLTVPIEGSTQWGIPGYVDTVRATAHEISGKDVVLENIPAAGRRGAGVAALGTLLQK